MELIGTDNTDAFQVYRAKKGKRLAVHSDLRELYDPSEAQYDLAATEKMLARLRKKRGCALPRTLDKPRKPEGRIKGRSGQFVAFLDSN